MTAPDPKRILMIAYHYPPANNGGVHRSAAFAHYLPSCGWEPHVLTTNLRGRDPQAANVTYTGEPASWYRRLKRRRSKQERSTLASLTMRSPNRWARKWMIPDVQIAWALFALLPALRLMRREQIDGLYSSSPPVSSHLLAWALKRLTGKPWLMDLRDPWTIEPMNEYLRQSGLRLQIERWLERRCMGAADRIILNTPQAGECYRALYPQWANKMRVIPNGYDAEEFAKAAQIEPPYVWGNIPTGAFVLSHVGAFHRRQSDDPTPHAFLDALKRLTERGVINEHKLRVIFAGSIHPRTVEKIRALGLERIITLPGTLPHLDALKLMQLSDALLFYDPDADGQTYVRGKLYEYLAARKPILGIVPDGASRDLIARSGRGLLAYPSDVDAVTSALEMLLAGHVSATPGDLDLSAYERFAQTQTLAALLNEITK